MKYAIFVEDEIDYQIGKILKIEIERFDIRAEVLLEKYSSKLNRDNLDALISIGEKALKISYRSSLRHYFFHQSYKRIGNWNKNGISNGNHKVVEDLSPSSSNDGLSGSLLFDWFRISPSISLPKGKSPFIAIIPTILAKNKRLKPLTKSVSEKFHNFSVQLIDRRTFMEGPQIIKEASAAIVSCTLGEMAAIYFNVPYVRLIKKSFFSPNEQSIANFLFDDELVKEYKINKEQEIIIEIDHLLNDHQYCASMMDNFQKVKESVSNLRIRNLAQRIVDSLED